MAHSDRAEDKGVGLGLVARTRAGVAHSAGVARKWEEGNEVVRKQADSRWVASHVAHRLVGGNMAKDHTPGVAGHSLKADSPGSFRSNALTSALLNWSGHVWVLA